MKWGLMSNGWIQYNVATIEKLILWMSCCNITKKAYLKSLDFVPKCGIWRDLKFVRFVDEILKAL